MEYYVYLLQSAKDSSAYIGCTNNLDRRLIEHNSGLEQYTKSKLPWNLRWYSVFYDKEKAYQFEKYLKTASGKAFVNKRLFTLNGHCPSKL